MSEVVGFIGLGRMGKSMAINMTRKGFRLVVHDVNRAAVEELEQHQARGAADAAEVARAADVVVTCLPNSAIVSDVVGRHVVPNQKAGGVVMDMSTISPETTDAMAAAAEAAGLGFVDAPIGRLASHADRGESLFMVGGSDADFARVKPMLEAMGTTIHHCGGVGTGTRTKLVNNFLAVCLAQLNGEALALSQRFGLDLEKTLEVLHGTTATNGQLKLNLATKVLMGDVEPGFSIDLAHKDLTLILEAANGQRVPLQMGASAREALSFARAQGKGGMDFSGLVDVLCDVADIPKPRLRK